MDVAHPPRRRLAGLTLVELLATLAVLVTVMALGVPTITDLVDNQDTVTASNTIAANLALARHVAITEGEPVVLCPSQDGWSCSSGYDWSDGWLVFRDADADREHDADEARLAVVERTSDRVRIQTSSGRRRVIYQRHGGSGGSNVSFRICNTRNSASNRRVIVNITGRVRVEHSATTGKPITCD